LLFALRKRLLERVATLWWRLRSGRPVGALVRATWRLIERRARAAGVARRPGMTPAAWAAEVRSVAPGLGPCLAKLTEVADWMTPSPKVLTAVPFATDIEIEHPEAEIRSACRLAVRGCTVTALGRARARRQKVKGKR